MALAFYMAPIRGVTNCIYRNIYHELFGGYDGAIVPFIENCTVRSITHKVYKDLFSKRNCVPYQLTPQVLTKSSRDFIIACKSLKRLGYSSVNWNLGCPHKRIRNRLHGAGLLPHPDAILSILDEVFPKIDLNLSLKVRLGSEDPLELSRLLPFLDGYPIKEIIIHPRTGVQMYGGDVDVDAFETCLSLTQHKVIFNGDINTPDQFHMLQERFPELDAWMIGRGGIINPFLLEELRRENGESKIENRIKRYQELHDAVFDAFDKELSGWGHKLGKMKEYWYYWSQAFSDGRKLYLAITRTKKQEQYTALIASFFTNDPALVV